MGQIHCRFFTCSCDWKVCGSAVNLQRDILLIGHARRILRNVWIRFVTVSSAFLVLQSFGPV